MISRILFDDTALAYGETVYSSTIYWDEIYDKPIGNISNNLKWRVTADDIDSDGNDCDVDFTIQVTIDGTNYIDVAAAVISTVVDGTAKSAIDTIPPCKAFRIKAEETTNADDSGATISAHIVVV
jgi:hypothetical protein